jgi:hypothetical protein
MSQGAAMVRRAPGSRGRALGAVPLMRPWNIESARDQVSMGHPRTANRPRDKRQAASGNGRGKGQGAKARGKYQAAFQNRMARPIVNTMPNASCSRPVWPSVLIRAGPDAPARTARTGGRASGSASAVIRVSGR